MCTKIARSYGCFVLSHLHDPKRGLVGPCQAPGSMETLASKLTQTNIPKHSCNKHQSVENTTGKSQKLPAFDHCNPMATSERQGSPLHGALKPSKTAPTLPSMCQANGCCAVQEWSLAGSIASSQWFIHYKGILMVVFSVFHKPCGVDGGSAAAYLGGVRCSTAA